jgi:hypothetical protein
LVVVAVVTVIYKNLGLKEVWLLFLFFFGLVFFAVNQIQEA